LMGFDDLDGLTHNPGFHIRNSDEFDRRDVNLCFAFAFKNMHMRWLMIVGVDHKLEPLFSQYRWHQHQMLSQFGFSHKADLQAKQTWS